MKKYVLLHTNNKKIKRFDDYKLTIEPTSPFSPFSPGGPGKP